jgi:pseudo-rSAM protein
MVIFENGDVFTDVNQKATGNIYQNSISELIWKELETGKSWLRIRKQQKPCNKCIFREFCPPTSNIEMALRKNDLCYKSME